MFSFFFFFFCGGGGVGFLVFVRVLFVFCLGVLGF